MGTIYFIMFKRVGLSISRITSTSTKRSFGGLSSKKAFPNRISSYSQRLYSTHNFNDVKLTDEAKEALKAERDADEADVVIVGGGPAGLSAAIRIKQLCNEQGKDLRVVLLEKGADVGNHILSGAVLDPRYFQQMFPDWKEMGAPLNTPVTSDQFKFLLNDNTSVPLPIPPSLHNDGNYIVSLGEVCRWLGEQAEALGVEVFPGFAASELLRDESGAVCGVATADSGISKSGDLKGNFARGMELRAPVTLLAEGCRGSLTGQAEQWFNLGEKRLHPQSYGIGLKEVWSVAEGKHNPGHVLHTAGWPVDNETYAGSFLYHLNGDDRLVALGYVVGLDYKNPFLNPYKEFQKLKHHSVFKEILEGGECVAYGARALNEGGYQAIPKLYFPGGALLGCAAGFLNLPKIKGSHNAMLSGMLAGEAVVDKLLADSKPSGAVELDNYSAKMLSSDAVAELKAVRNIRPAFTSPLGNVGGILYAAANDFVTKGKEPWTLTLKHADHETLRPAKDSKAPEYAAPDGKLSFDLLTNLSRANTNHEEDQPPHLRVQNPALPVDVNLDVYDGPEQRFCPAGVYEFVDDSATGGKKLQINAQNCIHCKTCSIKDPSQNIRWTVPENGGGPNYGSM